jgi:streptogramin lyase/N-acetylneuraminic acid mutarotase
MWFTETNGKIGRITMAGVITEFPVATSPGGITTGPDGNLWFTDSAGIGRITPAGVFTQFNLATTNPGPSAITTGPDGNLWFTEYNSSLIGKITPTGTITEFTGSSTGPSDITLGPDGNLWYTTAIGNKIGRITTSGVITEFATPTTPSSPFGIASGSDGNLWFTESATAANRIGRITTAGVITEFVVPTSSCGPYGITLGPDGNLWFTENSSNKLGRITTASAITEFTIPTANPQCYRIASGPDGNVWFTEDAGNKIGRFSPSGGGGGGAPLEFVSGGNGSSAAGLSIVCTVRAIDGNGNPKPGVSVTWVIGYGGGSISPPIVTTDSNGLASTSWTLGTTPQQNGMFAELTSNPSLIHVDYVQQGVAGPPSRLGFTVEPSKTTTIGALSPAVRVALEDQFGNVCQSVSPSITLSLNAGGVLQGAATQVQNSPFAEAVFWDLAVDKPGTGYALTASSTGFTSVQSSSFDVTFASPVWQGGASLPQPDAYKVAALGSDGRVYASGTTLGPGTTIVDAFDPVSGKWTRVADLPAPRRFFAMAEGSDGRIYVLGGQDPTGVVLANVVALAPGATSWSSVPDMPTARYLLAAATGGDGRLAAIGGNDANGNPLANVELFSPASGTWTHGQGNPDGQRSNGLACAAGADGRIYVFGGFEEGPNGTGVLGHAGAYDPVADSWTQLPNMLTPRTFLAAAAGADGRIYAIGGTTGNTGGNTDGTARVEAFSAATQTWTVVPSLLTPRLTLGAATLPDGRLFAIGGSDPSDDALSSTETFGPRIALSPASGAAGSQAQVSGSNFGPSATVNVYLGSATSGTLIGTGATDASGAIAPAMNVTVPSTTPMGTQTITVVDTGSSYPIAESFLVLPPSPAVSISPSNGPAGTTVQVSGSGFTPNAAVTVRWGSPSSGMVLGSGSADASGSLNPPVNVVIPPTPAQQLSVQDNGGGAPASMTFTLALQPLTPGWTAGDDMPTPRVLLAASLGPDGRIYAFGGESGTGATLANLEAYDPFAHKWSSLAPMLTGEDRLGGVTGADGRIYAIGGSSNSNADVQAYDSSTNTWTAVASLPTGRTYPQCVLGSDRKIYAIGGFLASPGLMTGAMEAYDSSANQWTTMPAMPTPRIVFGATVGPDGRIYAMGGISNAAPKVATVEIYDVVSGTWSTGVAMPTADRIWGALTGPDDRIYAFGNSSEVMVFDLTTQTWSSAPARTAPTFEDFAVSVGPDGRLYTMDGDGVFTTASSSVEVYGPVMTLTPTTGSPGSTVTVNGSSFAASATVQVYWGNPTTGTLVASGSTDASGTLTAPISFTVPAGAAAGAQTVTVVDLQSVFAVTAPFTVP